MSSSMVGGLSHILWKITHVWNHQPANSEQPPEFRIEHVHFGSTLHKFAQAQKDILKTQYMCNNYLTCEHDEGKESNIERGRESVWLNRFGPS